MPAASGHRYCLFSAHYPPHVGGVETYTASLATALAGRGDEVMVVTNRLSDDTPLREVQGDAVEVLRLPCHPLIKGRLPIPKKNAQYKELMSRAKTFAPDRVVVNTRFYPHSVEGVRLAQGLGAGCVVLDHGSAYLTFGNPAIDQLVKLWEHAFTAKLRSYGVRFGAVSSAGEEWLRTFKIESAGIAPNAIDADEFAATAAKRDFREELGVAPGRLLAAYVGRLIPEKGINALLEAVERCGGGADFAIAGEGPLADEVLKAAGANPRIHYLGRLASEEVASLLLASDVLLMPSRSEGFGRVFLETGAAGCLVATTNVGAVVETGIARRLPDGSIVENNGILLPDASSDSLVAAVQWCLDNGAERRRRAKAHAAFIRSHNSWQQTVDMLDALFERKAAQGV